MSSGPRAESPNEILFTEVNIKFKIMRKAAKLCYSRPAELRSRQWTWPLVVMFEIEFEA